jgi:hypothetical protein
VSDDTCISTESNSCVYAFTSIQQSALTYCCLHLTCMSPLTLSVATKPYQRGAVWLGQGSLIRTCSLALTTPAKHEYGSAFKPLTCLVGALLQLCVTAGICCASLTTFLRQSDGKGVPTRPLFGSTKHTRAPNSHLHQGVHLPCRSIPLLLCFVLDVSSVCHLRRYAI